MTVWIAPESAPFDEESNTCLDQGVLKISELFVNVLMLAGIMFVWYGHDRFRRNLLYEGIDNHL